MKRASLNHSFRLVWSKRFGGLVAVAETAQGRGKGSAAGLITALLLSSLPFTAKAALPTGGTVEAGTGSISQSGNAMTINQGSDKLAINWNSFSIGAGNSVTFNQPNSSSVALNRVLGSDVSVIQGALNANGQVFLVNPNGVLFSPSAQVNVGGIVASTLNISTSDFMAGNYHFEGSSSNAIINQGNIQAANDGTIALIAAKITNTGSLTASGGNVLLGAGSRVTLDLGGPVKLEVEQGAIDALIEQGGAIKADGGRIYLTAKAAGDLASTVINHTGITEAHTLSTGEKGEIVLLGDMKNDHIQVAGTLDASAPNGGDGGFIETSAAVVQIQPELRVSTQADNGKTGEWLIDPADITVAASGGNITGAALSAALGSTNVTLDSTGSGLCTGAACSGLAPGNGDIFINDAVTWSSGTIFLLRAYRNIEINAPIDASQGSGGVLGLAYGLGAPASGNTATYAINAPVSLQSGTKFATAFGSDGADTYFTVVNSQADLQAMSLTGNYALGSSVSLSGDWTPVGSSPTPFSGRFDGLGHRIENLRINVPNGTGLGFFGVAGDASISNVGLVNASVTGLGAVGILAGEAQVNTTIYNSFSTGSVTGTNSGYGIGGLVGYSQGRVTHSHSSAQVSGDTNAGMGGLVGINAFDPGSNSGLISHSYASGAVTNTNESNGLTGGLVGRNYGGAQILNSYATGNVTGHSYVGGLVGENNGNGLLISQIIGSYASGKVTATNADTNGGLVGYNANDASVAQSYWDIDSTAYLAGTGSLSNPIESEDVYGIRSSTGTVNAYTQADYFGFDFTNTWYMIDGYTRPFLRSEWRQTVGNAHELQLMAMKPDASYTLANNIDLVPVLTSQSEMWRCFATDCTSFQGSWSAVGRSGQSFNGRLDGDGHTISGLTINNSAADYQGLFGFISNASLTNLNLSGVNIQARDWIGGLVGRADDSQIDNVHLLSGQVLSSNDGSTESGSSRTGGLVGLLLGASQLSDSSSAATVQGYNRVGGLVGETVNNTGSAIVSNSTASGSVTGNEHVGGLVGYANLGSQISSSHASGSSSGRMNVGGLVGYATGINTTIANTSASGLVTATDDAGDGTGPSDAGGLIGSMLNGASVEESWASGSVTSTGRNIGGLVGFMGGASTIDASFATGHVLIQNSNQGEAGGLVGGVQAGATGHVRNSYASGSVTASDTAGLGTGVGGLIGRVRNVGSSFSVINSYASSQVSSPSGRNVGGLVGVANGAVVANSYWDVQASGQTSSAGGEGKTTAELKQFALFNDSGWNVVQDENLASGYPKLAWQEDRNDYVWVIGTAANTSGDTGGGDAGSGDTGGDTSSPLLGAIASAQAPINLPGSTPLSSIGTLNFGGSGAQGNLGGTLEFVEVGEGSPARPGQVGSQPSGVMRVLVVNGGINSGESVADNDGEDI